MVEGTLIDWGMTIGVASLICTIILSVLAIGLSVYFYVQGRATETRITTALAEIRQQTTALDKLSGRLLDRLARAVTESAKPEHEERRMLLLFQAVRQFNSPTSTPREWSPEERGWVINIVAAAHFYAGVANVLLQHHVPASIGDVEEDVRRLVDMSCADFALSHSWLVAPGVTIPEGNSAGLFSWAQQWRPYVRDTLGVFAARSAESGDTAPNGEEQDPGH